MSQSQQSEHQQSGAQYADHDWWGNNDVDDESTTGHDPAEFHYKRERAQWVAHDILKQAATLACPIALNADPNRLASLFEWLENGTARTGHDPDAMHTDNEVVELTDPEIYMPLQTSEDYGGRPLEYGQRPSRSRINPEHGYIVGPQILDMAEDEFLAIIDMVLDHLVADSAIGLSKRERDKLARDSRRLKQAGDRRDTDVLATIIHDATSDGPIIE
ncbi:hypothetical protein [Natrialba aegyptia]|uniref:Uncharacterized protein n=1 Tax=Natrialba aegyptia DSM 13077 TaxID=1227491 RepID=M0B7V6_9EURY|nr:hypothetical protein [Natrialba aegyptia]ELZ05729.1 hypothetical protein C480_10040 [Natrialba aegyptia DSM 13077]